jgi:hypothetical protein
VVADGPLGRHLDGSGEVAQRDHDVLRRVPVDDDDGLVATVVPEHDVVGQVHLDAVRGVVQHAEGAAVVAQAHHPRVGGVQEVRIVLVPVGVEVPRFGHAPVATQGTGGLPRTVEVDRIVDLDGHHTVVTVAPVHGCEREIAGHTPDSLARRDERERRDAVLTRVG